MMRRLMKAGRAEPEQTADAGEWLGKHASAVTDTRISQQRNHGGSVFYAIRGGAR
jgi:hypothetical protein